LGRRWVRADESWRCVAHPPNWTDLGQKRTTHGGCLGDALSYVMH
jgi:hypothetical protein